MIDHDHPLLLGSASPRRREILQTLRIPTIVVPGRADEQRRPGEQASTYIERVVREKLASVAAKAHEQPGVGGLLVADTIVLLGDQVLGKPATMAEAEHMLRQLSGRAHEVWTRFAIARPNDASHAAHEQTVVTKVHFRNLSEAEIHGYAASGEGLDKAGAYAVQGLGAFAVRRIEGSYANVVGLPACEVIEALEQVGLLVVYP